MSPTRPLALLPLAAIVCFLPGCETKINDANFDLIKPGMTQNDVEKILGKGKDETTEGTGINSSGVAGTSHSTDVVFDYKDGTKVITVTYRDNKVVNAVKRGF